MYAGAMTDATPTPMPPTTRNRPNIHTLAARPVPKALMRNSSAAIFITESLPILSASRPATSAPSRGADQCRRDRDTGDELADLEVFFNSRHRAVDDRAVVAEQQPAKGCYRSDSDDAAAVFGFLVVHA